MWGKHKGSGTGSQGQGAGTHRGAETGNGRTASTGRTDRSKPTVTFQGSVPGQKSRLRTIGDVLRGKKK